MCNVPDNRTKFFCYNTEKDEIFCIGDKNDLILLLSEGYEVIYCSWQMDVQNKYFPKYSKCIYEIYNHYGRPIEINQDIKVAVREKFVLNNGFSPENLKWKKVYEYRKRNKPYRGEFRREPVEGIHKYRQHYKSAKVRRYKSLVSERLNPEMKGFCRGNKPDFWDLGYVEYKLNKSWKKQSKRKHQWKDK